MKRKAIIFGIKGIKLTTQERLLIKKEKPWGIILSSRNIKDILQLKFLPYPKEPYRQMGCSGNFLKKIFYP